MERLLLNDLRAWREHPKRKPLVLRGVRQCGKTWLLQEFGRRDYASQVYLNFEREPSLTGLFEADLDPQRIIRDLAVLRNQTIDPATTLIIMDEVQACPVALSSLKYFAEETPQFSVAAAGSLLGLAIHQSNSFPVGKVDFLELQPLSFREFLMASGNQALADYLGDLRPGQTVLSPLAVKAEDLLRQYMMIGGMPEVVAAWLERTDMAEVETIQQAILDSYSLDMAKHAGATLFPKLSAIWRSIPGQLAKENQKFIFSQAVAGARAKDLEDALEWLLAAGIALKLTKVSRPAIPLSAYADDRYFKLFLVDVGLLRRLAGVPAVAVSEPTAGYVHFRGALAENYVMTQLLAANSAQPYFWRSENTAEVDFVITVGSRVVPIEVKSEHNTASKSLAVYKSRYDPVQTLRISLKPTVDGHLPLYAAWDTVGYLERSLD